jgi:hypothetical protein
MILKNVQQLPQRNGIGNENVKESLDKESSVDKDNEEDIEFDISNFKDIEEILRDNEEEEEKVEDDMHFEKLEFIDPRLLPYLDDTRKKESKYKLVTRRIDNNRIRHKNTKNQEICTGVLKNIKMTADGPIRSGAIIYTHYCGKTYFCVGQDSIYGDLTDFSGGKKQNETVIEAGLRELEEESLGVFGKITTSDVRESMGFYCTNMLIMFIRRDVDIAKTKKEFAESLQKKLAKTSPGDSIEVNDIVWLETKEFVDILNGKGRRIYSRVKRILSKVVDIITAI